SRVVRGGAFSHGRQYTRCAFRKYIDPSRRSDNIGFRVALALSLVSG
ncbi:SUMF1/EgtB/PvdO family nonheme iron enzyme, partial [candidate division KSB1 bacterium]|nr:SUMF1/EgtB/PvdO family nonheme iron enzyme [candidate division KSB1 bacterium]